MVRGLKTSNILVWIQSININWWFSQNVLKVSNPRNNCLSQSWVEIILASWQCWYSRVKRLPGVSSVFGFLETCQYSAGRTWILFYFPLNRQKRCLLSVSFIGSISQTLFLATQILYIDFEIITWFPPFKWADKFKIWNIDVLGIILLEIEIYLYNTNI